MVFFSSSIKAKVSSLKLQLEASEQSLAAQLRSAKEEKMELQGSLQGKELQLSSQIEELKAKVRRDLFRFQVKVILY